MKKTCGARNDGAVCEKKEGHYGWHSDSGYIFGPEVKRPKKKPGIDVVLAGSSYGGWDALYINGKKVEENSTLAAYQVLERVAGKTVRSARYIELDGEWASDEGSFPDTLKEAEQHLSKESK